VQADRVATPNSEPGKNDCCVGHLGSRQQRRANSGVEQLGYLFFRLIADAPVR
jgi:hypothetical protein